MTYDFDHIDKGFIQLQHFGKDKEMGIFMGSNEEIRFTKDELHEFIGTLLHIQSKMNK